MAAKSNLSVKTSLATSAPGDHLRDLSRMERDQYQMGRGEQDEQDEPAEMDNAGGIVAAKQEREKVKLDRLVDCQP